MMTREGRRFPQAPKYRMTSHPLVSSRLHSMRKREQLAGCSGFFWGPAIRQLFRALVTGKGEDVNRVKLLVQEPRLFAGRVSELASPRFPSPPWEEVGESPIRPSD